jgi:diphthamide synthase subunit DPH2
MGMYSKEVISTKFYASMELVLVGHMSRYIFKDICFHALSSTMRTKLYLFNCDFYSAVIKCIKNF